MKRSKKKKKKNKVSDKSGAVTPFDFKDGSHGTHLEQEKKMKHENFPLFLREGFEEAGEKINK